MESGRAAPLFRMHRRVRTSLPNDLNPGSGDQHDRSDNRIRQLMTAGARHRNGDKAVVWIGPDLHCAARSPSPNLKRPAAVTRMIAHPPAVSRRAIGLAT
jgi:hypothetical protein